MNSLSWILYLSEVSDTGRWFCFLIAVLSIIGTIVGFCFWVQFGSDAEKLEDEIKVRPNVETLKSNLVSMQANAAGSKTVFRRMVIVFLFFFLIATILPSKNTLYLIAASQVGEQVLTSDPAKAIGGEIGGVATDTMKLLRDYLQKQVTPPVTINTPTH